LSPVIGQFEVCLLLVDLSWSVRGLFVGFVDVMDKARYSINFPINIDFKTHLNENKEGKQRYPS